MRPLTRPGSLSEEDPPASAGTRNRARRASVRPRGPYDAPPTREWPRSRARPAPRKKKARPPRQVRKTAPGEPAFDRGVRTTLTPLENGLDVGPVGFTSVRRRPRHRSQPGTVGEPRDAVKQRLPTLEAPLEGKVRVRATDAGRR